VPISLVDGRVDFMLDMESIVFIERLEDALVGLRHPGGLMFVSMSAFLGTQ
jgi:hypothetical protein